MAARRRIPLGFHISRGRSTSAGMQSLVNLYAEPIKAEGRAPVVLYPTPCKTLFSTVGSGSVRGQVDIGGIRHYGVIGTTLYGFNLDGTYAAVGTVEGANRVDMDYNGTQLVIVADLKSYVVDITGPSIAELSDPDLGQATSTASTDGYSLFTLPDTDRFVWADLRNAASIDALSFASADSNGDPNVAVRVAKNDVWLFARESTEFFYSSGNPDQQFESRNIAPLEIGCLARDSIVLVDAAYMWVGRDGHAGGYGVYRAEGYQARNVANPAVSRYLEEYSDLSDCYALAYQWHGHLFYVLTLPGSVTLAYDVATGEWLYKKSGAYASNSEPLGGWDAVTFATNGSNRIVGASDGNLYKLDGTVWTDNGETVIREVTCSQVRSGGNYAIMHRLEVDMEYGNGLATGQGSNPLIQFLWSDDGGRTWSVPRTATMGMSGKNKVRAFTTMCGRFRNRIVKIRTSEPIPFALFDCYADIEDMAA